jgi:Tol biopolymer transport system component
VNTNSGPTHIADGGAVLVDTLVPGNAGSIAATNQGLAYYDEATGQFYVISPDGSTKTLMTDAKYPQVQNIDWAKDGMQAVLTFPDNTKVIYNFATKKQISLPTEYSGFSFSPDGGELVSKYLDASNKDNQWLVVTTNTGTSAQSVEQLGRNADYVTSSWSPNNTVIASYEKATNTDQSEIIFLGKNGENLPSATIPGKGFEPLWSSDGQHILFSAYSSVTNDNPHLYLMNGSSSSLGQNIIDLGLDTWAHKCVFSQNGYTVYCAVPYYLNAGSGPQPSLSSSIPDNIYEINLVRGTSNMIAMPVDSSGAQRFSIGALRLSPDESNLMFLDQQTGSVQRIQLP